MAMQDLTASGVAAKQTELNALSQNDLEIQAGDIASDFRSWIADNFNLSTAQSDYLTDMDDSFISYAANLTSFAVLNKLTVSLGQDGSDGLKLIHISDDIVCTNTSSNTMTLSGGVSFQIVYSS